MQSTNPGGLDIGELSDHVRSTGSVVALPRWARRSIRPSSWSVEAELAVPAALEGAIDATSANSLSASVVVEAANGPTTPEADEILVERGVTVVPDILANAGGVTASYFEWAQSRSGFPWEEEIIAKRLASYHGRRLRGGVEEGESLGVSMRRAAGALAVERVAEAFSARGLFPDRVRPVGLSAAVATPAALSGAIRRQTPLPPLRAGRRRSRAAAVWRIDGSAPA